MARKSESFERVWLLLLSMLIAALGLTAFHRLGPPAGREPSAVDQPAHEINLPYVPRVWVNSPFEFVAGLGGSVQASAISGTLAFVGEGANLTTVDVSDPAAPAPLAHLSLPAPVNDLQLDGGLAYVATERGLALVDLLDPLNPRSLSHYYVPEGISAIFVAGPHAFLAAREAGLLILDVSDPARPVWQAVFPEPVYDVWVENDLAYVVAASDPLSAGTMRILDVSDPTAPAVVGSYEDVAAREIQVVGQLAYVLHGDGLDILDVSDPASPALAGRYDMLYAGGMWVEGDHAFLLQVQFVISTNPVCIFWVLDVSDPAQPAPVGHLTRSDWSGCDGSVQTASGLAHISNGAFRILEVTDPAAPTQRGIYSMAPVRAAVEAPLAYIAEREGSLEIVDVSDLHQPDPIGSYQTEGAILSVKLVGNLAYLIAHKPSHPHFPSGSFEVVDVGDPANPQQLGSFSTRAAPDFDIEGERAYLIDRPPGFPNQLVVLDLSDPTAPTEILVYKPSPDPFTYTHAIARLDAVGSTVYLAVFELANPSMSELRILDTSDPLNPVVQGAVPISYSVDVEVVGGLALSAAPDMGLQIVDVSDPFHPVRVGSFVPAGSVSAVQLVGRTAYLAGDQLRWVDLADPANPQLLGAYPTVAGTGSIQVIGDLIYLVNSLSGMHLLRLK